MELQEQTNSYTRDLRGVQVRLANMQRESRATQATGHQISELNAEVPLYRAVGKAFVATPRAEVEEKLEKDLETNIRNQRDLTDRVEYLERRIQSNTVNLKELTAGL